MEVYLAEVKNVCKHLLREEALIALVARNVHDLFSADTLQRIQGAVFATQVWSELSSASSLGCARICSSALLKLRQLALGAPQRPASGLTDTFMDATRAADIALLCMTKHGMIAGIQENGSCVLASLISNNYRDDALISFLASTRGTGAICLALKTFPDNPRVQDSALGVIIRIRRAFLVTNNHDRTFYMELINANTLVLSVAALVHHPTDRSVVLAALVVLRSIGISRPQDPATRRAFLDFVRVHGANMHIIIQAAVDTQRQLHPNNNEVIEEANIVRIALAPNVPEDVVLEA